MSAVERPRPATAPTPKVIGVPAAGAALAATPAPLAERLGQLRDYMQRDIASGYYSPEQVLQNARDAFEGEMTAEELAAHEAALLADSLAAQAAAEETWPAITDCDRLDAAFAELEADGIIARQNFTCCGTCGSSEIWDEIDEVRAAGSAARGYTFFHMQDTERAAEGDGIYLAYGACDEGEEAALAVADEIVERLHAHGLQTDWDGSWGRRIGVALDWKRRRPGGGLRSLSLH